MILRQSGKLAAGAALLQKSPAAAAETAYAEALDGLESTVDLAAFDPVNFARKLNQSGLLKMMSRAQNRRQAEAWQGQLRAKVTELVGDFASTHDALHGQTLEVREFPGYLLEKFLVESRLGLAVLGYLLVPSSGKSPYHPIICIPGHGRGVDAIVRIDDTGHDRTTKDSYQQDFAIQVTEHGMAAVAIEPMAVGCRRGTRAKKEGLGHTSCQPVAGAALLLGPTMIGSQVFYVMRTIGWKETRKELDSSRIGCMGISGGGTCTAFSTALDPRIKVSLISGYLNTFRDSIFGFSHCIDNCVPDILKLGGDVRYGRSDCPAPSVPRVGHEGGHFPMEASRASFPRVKKSMKHSVPPKMPARSL